MRVLDSRAKTKKMGDGPQKTVNFEVELFDISQFKYF